MRKMDRRMEGWEQAALPGHPILLGSNTAIPQARLLQVATDDTGSSIYPSMVFYGKASSLYYYSITRMSIQIIPVL